MTYRDGVLTGTIVTALVAGLAGSIWWLAFRLDRETAPKGHPAPAQVTPVLKEEQITTIMLTKQAADRLKLQTGVVESKGMPRTRLFGAELTIPLGRTVIVQAPMSGVVHPPLGGIPDVGRTVTATKSVLLFHPLLTPEGRAQIAASRVDADGQVKAAESQRTLARQARDRAQKVFESEAGSRRAVEEAQAQLDIAQRTLDAATARRALLDRFLGEFDKGTASPIPIEAPTSGILRSMSALPGQRVPAGAALFEVIDPKTLWVKVPVFAGELESIDVESPVSVGRLSARPDAFIRVTKAIAPPAADPLSATVDLFYDLDNADGHFRPGERVAARVLLKGEAKSLTVPWSAIVYDIHGGTWVYEQIGELGFVRRRVQVKALVGTTAILVSGPPKGTKIVVVRAQELFGTETGFTK